MAPPDPTHTDEHDETQTGVEETAAAAQDTGTAEGETADGAGSNEEEFVDTDAPRGGETGEKRRERLRERASSKEERIAEERLAQGRRMAEVMRHLRDCPEEGALPGEGDRRVEHFPATKPATDRAEAQPMLVVRCIECGESEVAPDESEGS
jgi:hypothetical protein